MKIFEIMGRLSVTARAEDSINSAAQKMKRYGVSVLAVVGEKGKFRGILTDRDIVLRAVAIGDDILDTRVGDVMTRRLLPPAPGDDIIGAAEMMGKFGVQQLPVVDHGRMVGMLSLADLAGRSGNSAEILRALGGKTNEKTVKTQ